MFPGISNACLFGNGLVMIGHYFDKRRSLANALALTGASIGQFVMPPVLQYLIDTYGLSGTILVMGSLYLELIVCGALYRPLSFYTEPYKRKMLKRQEQDALLKGENEIVTPDCSGEGNTPIEQNSTEMKITVDNNHADRIERKNLISEEDNHDSALKNRKNQLKLGYMSSTGSLIMGSVENMAVVTVEAKNESKKGNAKPENEGCVLNCCGKRIKLPKLFYLDVLKNPVVIMFVFISFIIFFGYFNFIIFMPADAKARGVSKYKMTWLVSIAGIGDLLGRICVGILGDLNLVRRYKIMSFVVIICGVNIFLFDFARAYWLMALHAGIYGFFGGAYVAINAVVLIDLVGMETMPKALGMVILIQGAGAALGQPVLGLYCQEHVSENLTFFCQLVYNIHELNIICSV